MNPNNTFTHWENHFKEEALRVEEYIFNVDITLLNQSKIKIALENKIISWSQYKDWIHKYTPYATLSCDLTENQIQKLSNKNLENKKNFKHLFEWNDELIPLERWDQHLVVLGLELTESILNIPDILFIFCPPQILNEISLLKSTSDFEASDSESLDPNTSSNQTGSHTDSLLELDAIDSAPLNLNFSSLIEPSSGLNLMTEELSPILSAEGLFWDKLKNIKEIQEYSVNTHFQGFLILKIQSGHTYALNASENLKQFLDSTDLKKEPLSLNSPFKINFDDLQIEENFLTPVIRSETTEVIQFEKELYSLINFKYACVAPLKSNQKMIGFILGFKNNNPTHDDEVALENFSFEKSESLSKAS